MNQSKKYFKSLTGVRAIAAFMVYVHHFNPFPKESLIFSICQEMHIGVTIFFVLSGFLIAHRYLDMEVNLKNYIFYLSNRIARIYPTYFLITIIFYLYKYGLFFSKYSIFELFMNLTFLRGFFDNLKFTLVAPGWSLTVEETFYFLAPLFFLYISKKKDFVLIFPFILFSVGILFVFLSQTLHLDEFFGFFSSYKFMTAYTFFGRCFEFFVGISLALFFGEAKKEKQYTFNFTYFGVFVIVSSLYLLSTLQGIEKFGVQTNIGLIINNIFLPLIGISSLFYGLIREKTLIERFLSSNFLIVCGKISFVFYLIHQSGIFRIAAIKINELLTQNLSITFGGKILTQFFGWLIILLFIQIFSFIIFKFFEEPMNVKIRKKIQEYL